MANAIRTLREDRELTQEDVAYEAGLTPGSVSRIERGTRNPSWTTVERLATALDVSLLELAEAVELAGED